MKTHFREENQVVEANWLYLHFNNLFAGKFLQIQNCRGNHINLL